MNREKVIKGLDCCLSYSSCGWVAVDRPECPYNGQEGKCMHSLMTECSEVLKASAVWHKISPAGIYECSGCGVMVMTDDIDQYKFCHGCGRTMGWD